MENVFDLKFKEKAFFYIEEIFEEVSPFLSEFQMWHFDNSCVYADDKKIISRKININNSFCGYNIKIDTDDIFYEIIALKKSIELVKKFKDIDEVFCYKVELLDNDLKVSGTYQKDDIKKEVLSFDDKLSFKDIFDDLKNDLSNYNRRIRIRK